MMARTHEEFVTAAGVQQEIIFFKSTPPPLYAYCACSECADEYAELYWDMCDAFGEGTEKLFPSEN